MKTDWTRGLNPEQIDAVKHSHGPLLILAGAGSGKTTVLVSRAGRLVDEGVVDANKLCVLTFTNKAARELKHRVEAKLGSVAREIWAGTFHSFGLQLLRQYHKEAKLPREFGIIDTTDASSIVKELLATFHQQGKTAYDADKVLSVLSSWRESGRTAAVHQSDPYEVAVEWLIPKYEKRLEHLGMVDFDGLILKPLKLLKIPEIAAQIHASITHVMVDEFQDTNEMQMRLVRTLSAVGDNLAVVGDDDQSIYGWRGANVGNILDFPKLYKECKVVRLERNYRSSGKILDLANAVISKNTKRHSKVLRAARGEVGELPESFVYESENEESAAVADDVAAFLRNGEAPNEIAVLYRSNGQGAMLEAELRHRSIAYMMSGGTAFFDRKEIRDILAYLRCAFRPNEISFRRIINTPARGLGEKTVEDLHAFAEKHNLSFPNAAKRWREAEIEPRAGASLDALFDLLAGWVTTIVSGLGESPGARLLGLLVDLGYKTYLEKHSPDKVIAGKRWQLVEMFTRILDRFTNVGGVNEKSLKEFLEAMELRDTPDDKEKAKKSVQLLTLHACKGLEFDNVILMGVEEDLLPHKTLGSDVAEERRLFYVGITRARKKLILTRAARRRRHGKLSDCAPSRFLVEVSTDLYSENIGGRPVNESKRKSMVADLFKKLDSLPPAPR